MYDHPVGALLAATAVAVVAADVAWLAIGHRLRTVQQRNRNRAQR